MIMIMTQLDPTSNCTVSERMDRATACLGNWVEGGGGGEEVIAGCKR